MDLEDRIDSFPEPWKPDAGDKLVGQVVEIGERASDYGDGSYPIVTVLTEAGKEFSFHGFHTVAKNELARQRPRVGDRLAVKYFGKDEERGYERYRVIVEHAEPAQNEPVDWDTIEAASAAELTGDPGAWPEGAEAV